MVVYRTFGEAGSSSQAAAGDELSPHAPHAAMERWQTTLEDMMHLRSPGNQAFKDNYWVTHIYFLFSHVISLLQVTYILYEQILRQ